MICDIHKEFNKQCVTCLTNQLDIKTKEANEWRVAWHIQREKTGISYWRNPPFSYHLTSGKDWDMEVFHDVKLNGLAHQYVYELLNNLFVVLEWTKQK